MSKRKNEEDYGNSKVRQRATKKDCDVSKLDEDDLNSMRCEDCEYTENESRAYCNGVCNKTHEGKLRLCNRYILKANSKGNSPYLCKDHQAPNGEAVFEKDGEFKIRLVIIGNDVSYKGEHGHSHEYTVELCGKNRFLKKQEKKHEYDLKMENLKNLPKALEEVIVSDLTDDEIFSLFLKEEDNSLKVTLLSYYAERKKMPIGRAISQRVAQFQPLQVNGEIVLTSENLAKRALKFMLKNDIKPELSEIDKRNYKIDELISILALCTISPFVFKKFVEKTGMLSKKSFSYDYMLYYILHLFVIGYSGPIDNLPKALKYVYSCITLSNEEFIAIFWKFMRICDYQDSFDRPKIEIYKFFAEEKFDLKSGLEINTEYYGYSPESMQDRIKTYGYYAYPQQEFDLSDQEKKDRLDLVWLKKNVFSDCGDRSEWKENSERIIYTESRDKSLTSNQYFKRKMTSLGYPKECLGVMELEEYKNYYYYIDKTKFAELTNDREFMSDISKKRKRILSRDIGSIDPSIIGINSLFVDGWPLCLTEEGNPQYDEDSGTPPYLIGILLNSPEIIEYLKIWTHDNGIQFHAPKKLEETPPVPENSSLGLFTNPSEHVSIENWIKFKAMQLGESKLSLNDEEAENLKSILNNERYLVFELFDPEKKLQKLWNSWLQLLRTFIGYDI